MINPSSQPTIIQLRRLSHRARACAGAQGPCLLGQQQRIGTCSLSTLCLNDVLASFAGEVIAEGFVTRATPGGGVGQGVGGGVGGFVSITFV